MLIVLPFPSSKLSGQHNAHHWVTRPIINAHREAAAKAASGIVAPPEGDILIHVRFVPPDRRGDRVNFPNRMKAYFDGIADALGVNDSRFLPSYEFAVPEKPGRVEVEFSPQSTGCACGGAESRPVTGLPTFSEKSA
jgi:hypothetical protein